MGRVVDKAAAEALTRSGGAACWRCAAANAVGTLFCTACEAVQPPAAINYFARLGLPIRFDLDDRALERAYFDVQRRLHPDRFATRSAEERALALRQSTAINEAYEALRQPNRRGAYLLGLWAPELAGDEARTEKDPALLTEAMERREALAEAANVEAVSALAAEARAEAERCLGRIAEAFSIRALESAARQISRLKYLTRFAEEARVRRVALAGDRP